MAQSTLTATQQDAYWRKTSRLMWVILFFWFIASFVLPCLAIQLNTIVIFGFPLGFYMAAQGSLIVFVILCAWNAVAQNRIDEEFGVTED